MPEKIDGTEISEQLKPSEDRVVLYGSRAETSDFAENLGKKIAEAGIKDVSVEPVRDVSMIEPSFMGSIKPESDLDLPSRVFIFPHMRQEAGGMKMDVPTPTTYIKELCEKYGVEFAELGVDQATSDDYFEAIAKSLRE